MSRKHDIMTDAESELTGFEVDTDAVDGILCDGDGCRHAECECWDSFEKACEANLHKQHVNYVAEAKRMESLYKGEVKAGIHTPDADKKYFPERFPNVD